MGRRRLVIAGILRGAVMLFALGATLTAVTGCKALDLRNPWKVYYDPARGTRKEDILKHFNLHRGRWWNYYMRGSCLLAYEYYDAARVDFDKAIARRSEDKRDARTYGMHFIDYFPNRESGIAFYLEGRARCDPNNLRWTPTNDPNVEKKRYKDAVDALGVSLRQADSSRAKFYLNEARREYLRRTEDDSEGPIIWVKKPIRTNRRTVRFDVSAMDVQSHVAEIRIGTSSDNLEIDRSRYLVELAEQFVTRTVEVTLKPGKRMAVVEITAFDLVGNPSEVTKAMVILDTTSPQAAFRMNRDKTLPDGRVSVTVRAQDDFGLKRIQIGEDKNDALDCDGAFARSATVRAVPRNGKLAVNIIDCAGNRVAGHIPVGSGAGSGRLAQASWPAASWGRPFVESHVAWSRHELPLPSLLPDWGTHPPLMLRSMARGTDTEMASLAPLHDLAIRDARVRRDGTFYLPAQLCQEAALNPSVESKWNLDPRSVYQVVPCLFFADYAGQIGPWPAEKPIRDRLHRLMQGALEDLPLGGESSGNQQKRFGVHGLEKLTGESLDTVLDSSEDEIVRRIRHWQRGKRVGASAGPDDVDHGLIDLVLYGEVVLRKVLDKETFEITLRAKDVVRRKDLSFPDPWGKTEVVADIYGTVGDPNSFMDIFSKKILHRFPRHHVQVSFERRHWYSLRRSDVCIKLGEHNGVFEGMKLHFCNEADLERICSGTVLRVDHRSSLLKPRAGCRPPAEGVIAITK
jgi:hypothetical protein